MFERKSDVDRIYIPRSMGGRGLMSMWDSFKGTIVRLAHYLNATDDEQMQKCSQFDNRLLFSITKKAEKFCNAIEFGIPPNLENKPAIRQAKIVSQKFKEATQKERYDEFENKPQHGAFFRQLKQNELDVKSSLSWLDKCHLSP